MAHPVNPTTQAPATCPSCGEQLDQGARFCEACGHDLAVASPSQRLAASVGAPTSCSSCGGTVFSEQPDGGSYCDNCGVRRPAGRDHWEADLDVIAAVSDIGKRHHHNEDGCGLAVLPSAWIGVVCDGVSTSSRPDTASHSAADAATRTFLRILETATDGVPDAALAETATVAAAGAAQAAAADATGSGAMPVNRGVSNPPSTTFVSAVVTPDAITIGWIGDSRAYWLPDDLPDGVSGMHDTTIEGSHLTKPFRLTVDDTLGSQLAAAGVEVADDAPNVGALIRWLGADATDTAPHIAAFRPPGPGRVIVCSDGLYRYASEASDLAAAAPHTPPLASARSLVEFALEQGGGDNVSVIVLPYPPREGNRP